MSSEQTMQAIRVHEYGGPEQLRLERVPWRQPGEGEVLIRVRAAGVLPMDCAVRQGRFPGQLPRAFPYTPGSAIAGVIEAVGPGVSAFEPGQAICGRTTGGAYAEYTVTQVEAPSAGRSGVPLAYVLSLLAPKPETLSFEEAATLSAGATTAWAALFEDGELAPGQRALIHGAAGGVGLFAAQFARWYGAEVIGTASAGNLEFVRSLGAEALDYAATPLDQLGRELDFVLDTIGGETLTRSMRLVRPGGTLVSVVEEPPAELARELGIRALKNAALPTSEHLRTIGRLIDEGHAQPAIRQIFPLEAAAQAQALCETGHGRGRIVLQV